MSRMKNLLINLVFCVLYLATTIVWYFSLIGIELFALLIFVILFVNVIYNSRSPLQGPSEEFLEREKRREEKARRNSIIDRCVSIVDLMISKVNKLRLEIRNFFYILE